MPVHGSFRIGEPETFTSDAPASALARMVIWARTLWRIGRIPTLCGEVASMSTVMA